MTSEQLTDSLLDMARRKGATQPVFADSSDDLIVIVDIDSGRTWTVRLKEF